MLIAPALAELLEGGGVLDHALVEHRAHEVVPQPSGADQRRRRRVDDCGQQAGAKLGLGRVEYLAAFGDRQLGRLVRVAGLGQAPRCHGKSREIEHPGLQPLDFRQHLLRGRAIDLGRRRGIEPALFQPGVDQAFFAVQPGRPFRFGQQARFGKFGFGAALGRAIDGAFLDIVDDVALPLLRIGGRAAMKFRCH